MQVSSDHLSELLVKYDSITTELNNSITNAVELNNQLAVAKSLVAKWKNNQRLIEEQIRCEKQLIQAGR